MRCTIYPIIQTSPDGMRQWRTKSACDSRPGSVFSSRNYSPRRRSRCSRCPYVNFEALRSWLQIDLANDINSSAAWIVEKCFKGNLLKGRNVLLVVSRNFTTSLGKNQRSGLFRLTMLHWLVLLPTSQFLWVSMGA